MKTVEAPKPGTTPWHLTITASKAPKILSLTGPDSDHDYGGPRSVYEPMRAAYLGHNIPTEESSQVQRDGHHLETAIGGMWADRMAAKGNPVELLGHEVFFTRDDLGFPVGATPDDIATLTNTGERVTVQKKSDRNAGKGFGKPGTDEVPLDHYVQMLWELHIARKTDPNINRGFLVVLGSFLDINDYVINYDEAKALHLEQQLRSFYIDNVVAGVAPEPNGSARDYDAIRWFHRDINDKEWEIHPQLAIDVETARLAEKAAKAAHLKAKSAILDVMGNAKWALCGGQKIGDRRPTSKGAALYPAKTAPNLGKLYESLESFEQENAA